MEDELSNLIRQEIQENRDSKRFPYVLGRTTLEMIHTIGLAGLPRPLVGISGRYKYFKREVDKTRVEFERLGAGVIQPEKGSILHPTMTPGFFPIGKEQYFKEETVRDQFLMQMNYEDIHYIEIPDGTSGTHVSFEIGFAVGVQHKYPPYLIAASRPFKDIIFGEHVQIPVMSPLEAIKEWKMRVINWNEKKQNFPLTIVAKTHF